MPNSLGQGLSLAASCTRTGQRPVLRCAGDALPGNRDQAFSLILRDAWRFSVDVWRLLADLRDILPYAPKLARKPPRCRTRTQLLHAWLQEAASLVAFLEAEIRKPDNRVLLLALYFDPGYVRIGDGPPVELPPRERHSLKVLIEAGGAFVPYDRARHADRDDRASLRYPNGRGNPPILNRKVIASLKNRLPDRIESRKGRSYGFRLLGPAELVTDSHPGSNYPTISP